MANVAITVDKRNGAATLSNTGQIKLFKDETLTITVGGGFPVGTKVDTVNFRQESAGPTGPVVGSWNRDGTGVIAEGVTATKSGSNQDGDGVVITDKGTNDEDYYYEVWAGGLNADPELVVKKKTRPSGTDAPAPDPTP